MKKTALITGASTGIGKELARIHASRGGDLVIVARSDEKLHKLREELEGKYGNEVVVIVKDLSKLGVGAEIYEELKQKGITIDYLINNAGFGGQGEFHKREWEEDLAMINVNIIALSELTRLFLPEFIKKGRGKILNVSSTAALFPAGPLQAVYFASKAYVSSFSNAIAKEIEGSGVTVTALLPGATETEFAKVSGMEKTKLFKNTFSPKEVALDGYKGMLEGKLDVITGVTKAQKVVFKNAGIFPKKLVLKIIKKLQSV